MTSQLAKRALEPSLKHLPLKSHSNLMRFIFGVEWHVNPRIRLWGNSLPKEPLSKLQEQAFQAICSNIIHLEYMPREKLTLREAIVAGQTTEVGFLISQHLHMMIEERKHVVETFDTYFSA